MGIIDWLSADPKRLSNFIYLAGTEYHDLYFLFANWDTTQGQKYMAEALDRYPAFKMEAVFKDHAQNELRIYRYETDASTLKVFSGSIDRQNFAGRFYSILLGRMLELSALESWEWTMSKAADKRTAARDALKGLVSSSEFNNVNPTSELRVKKLYQALLDRSPTNEELESWTRQLESRSKSIDNFIDHLAESPEFSSLISRYFRDQGK